MGHWVGSLAVLESWVGGKVEPFQHHGRCLMTMVMDLKLLLFMEKRLGWALIGCAIGWA